MDYDVVVIGGGPAGSTLATLLKKYAPEARVRVLEREVFPRDHVGESQLPAITPILNEMGVWDKCEAAGFPVKTGAMYRWGSSDDLWKLDFLIGEKYENLPRPAKCRGQRTQTTFHVDRAVYDKILLDHAAECGVEVSQGSKVTKVRRDGDRVDGLELEDGTLVTARYCVDASGHTGFLRRNMGVGVNEPTSLKNIAIWDYWENEAWSKTVNSGGVRARIFSLGYGWIWFLPISETKTSVGFVTHADYYRDQGMTPQALYERALSEEPFLRSITPGAVRLNKFATTKDWSFTAERLVGENWFLVGESAGFADPILAAGMSLAQVGARELAYTLVDLLNGEHDPGWLKDWYNDLQLRRIEQHIRFADFWYAANGHWTDLKAYTAEIAKDAGLTLSPDEAFRWLSTGGFASDSLAGPIVGSYELGSAKCVLTRLTGKPSDWELNRNNELRLDLTGADRVTAPIYKDGKITEVRCYRKGARLLPILGSFKIAIGLIEEERDLPTIVARLRARLGVPPGVYDGRMALIFEAIEAMIAEGWVRAKYNKNRPKLQLSIASESFTVQPGEDPYAEGLVLTGAV